MVYFNYNFITIIIAAIFRVILLQHGGKNVVYWVADCKSPTRYIKTHHITSPNITPHRQNNFISQDVNHYPLITYICITFIISTKIILIF